MSRVTFPTGKLHQERAAVWARQRLADASGRRFSSPLDQDGVLFADSVGLGKTWEALAATALLLYKWTGNERGRRHVLVLCPANLVTKWEDELADGSPFRDCLTAWSHRMCSRGNGRVAQCVERTLSLVLPIRRSKHVRVRSRFGKFKPPGGTYVVSQSLVCNRGRGLSALRKHRWDVVICDEAHSTVARSALEALEARRRKRTTLLLSATPFQLEPRQFNDLARHVLVSGHRVLSRADIAPYVRSVEEVFKFPASAGPTPTQVRSAGRKLSLIAARTVPRALRRTYAVVVCSGETVPSPGRLDELDDASVHGFLDSLRMGSGARDCGFERAYFSERLRLALISDQTFLATRLRRILAAAAPGHESPRRRGLRKWARRAFALDIERSIETGLPHKTIVFTSWVGRGSRGEAAVLRGALDAEFRAALRDVRRRHGRRWCTWTDRGVERLRSVPLPDSLSPEARDSIGMAIRSWADDELLLVMVGRRRGFRGRLIGELVSQWSSVDALRRETQQAEDAYERRTLRRRLRERTLAASPYSRDGALLAVERYTGRERRSERDKVAAAFRRLGPPWAIVASNVGAEGIDLHTYTARIVHYDLEWNPARMEQREGRGDRVGRRLKEPLEVLYCLVPRTYDERMFHQLVARDRWHGVLLGKGASSFAEADVNAPLLPRERLRDMRLDLAPRP